MQRKKEGAAMFAGAGAAMMKKGGMVENYEKRQGTGRMAGD
jgi:hypothetical protein